MSYLFDRCCVETNEKINVEAIKEFCVHVHVSGLWRGDMALHCSVATTKLNWAISQTIELNKFECRVGPLRNHSHVLPGRRCWLARATWQHSRETSNVNWIVLMFSNLLIVNQSLLACRPLASIDFSVNHKPDKADRRFCGYKLIFIRGWGRETVVALIWISRKEINKTKSLRWINEKWIWILLFMVALRKHKRRSSKMTSHEGQNFNRWKHSGVDGFTSEGKVIQ